MVPQLSAVYEVPFWHILLTSFQANQLRHRWWSLSNSGSVESKYRIATICGYGCDITYRSDKTLTVLCKHKENVEPEDADTPIKEAQSSLWSVNRLQEANKPANKMRSVLQPRLEVNRGYLMTFICWFSDRYSTPLHASGPEHLWWLRFWAITAALDQAAYERTSTGSRISASKLTGYLEFEPGPMPRLAPMKRIIALCISTKVSGCCLLAAHQ